MNPLPIPLHRRRLIPALLQSVAVALPLLLLAARPADAASDPSSCAAIGHQNLDARLAAKAGEGVEPLRRFVTRTRNIHQLDFATAVSRAARYRQAADACTVASNVAP